MVNKPFSLLVWLGSIVFELAGMGVAAEPANAPDGLSLYTRARVPSAQDNGQFDIVDKTVRRDPKKTAVIVCDMWDRHWCKSANARVAEMAPQMNRFIAEARKRGMLIVHAPSDCMAAYEQHPARKRAQNAPKADLPDCLKQWCQGLDSEKQAAWPIDQADGGCDCAEPCKEKKAWQRQTDLITISDDDAISDSGVEIGNLFAERGIENVMLLGVHANMCVVGRPFGLRNMVQLGKNVLLVRDMTDTMYNPRKSPQVSHVRGTELIIEYIEKYICPTTTSSDLLGGPAFRFQEDKRPHVAMIVSDDHYHADKTLPAFAQMLRERHGCYCTIAHGQGKADIPGLDELQAADVTVLFIRRLALPKEQLDKIRAYVDAGKPLVALRTACHAFSIKKDGPPGTDQWPTFDKEVLGGDYHDHVGNRTEIRAVPGAAGHPILAHIDPPAWTSNSQLYKMSPLDKDATLLLRGAAEGFDEPIAWTRQYKGGRVFFCSLGHWNDFANSQFRTLLVNGIYWAMNKPVPDAL